MKLQSMMATGILLSAFLASSAHALVIGFQPYSDLNITQTEANALSGALSVDINELGLGQVEFAFNNLDAQYDASITDIYFGVAPFFGDHFTFGSFVQSAGVSFNAGATPSDIPGGVTFASFSADSDAPASGNGVELGESLSVIFSTDLSLAQIGSYFSDGSLQLAMHVQSIDSVLGDQSQWFLSVPPVVTPTTIVPVSVLPSGLLILVGLLAVRVMRKRSI